jgi:NNP family nitrate/nitrite transporter-like MFS transporter
VPAPVATWLLTYAQTYPQFLMAALVRSASPAATFAVGIAYVSKWFPQEKQGTALGIFGAGNIGSAVTKLLAPMVMVAYGWHDAWRKFLGRSVWRVTAVLFYLFTKDDPGLEDRRKAEAASSRCPFAEQMKPLKQPAGVALLAVLLLRVRRASWRWRCGCRAT